MKKPILGDDFERALVLAHQLHRTQTRKTNDIPYIAHLLSVAALVIEDGGNEEQAIAALLHDAIEDQGGSDTQTLIREQFGTRVASLVVACSDTDQVPKPPWRERKEAHIARIAGAEPAVLRIIAADKLHNARALVRDLRVQGNRMWGRFNGGRQGSLWYYRSLCDTLKRTYQGHLVEELERVVTELEQLAAQGQ